MSIGLPLELSLYFLTEAMLGLWVSMASWMSRLMSSQGKRGKTISRWILWVVKGVLHFLAGDELVGDDHGVVLGAEVVGELG